jgi:phosphoribosyl-dephospho-CoA transferase
VPWPTAEAILVAEGPARHELVWLDPKAWPDLIGHRDDLSGLEAVQAWCANGWPLVVRRPDPDSDQGGDRLALGLPLPPALGKRRIALDAPCAAVLSRRPPLRLEEASAAIPQPWRTTVDALLSAAQCCGADLRVFGALAWQALTGLDYLHAGSDLDLIATASAGGSLDLLDAVARIEAEAPMRIDLELVRPDGASANAGELRGIEAEILVKTTAGVELWPRQRFLAAP